MDISINGQNGFYHLTGESVAGAAWLHENVDGADDPDGNVCCDDTSLAKDIADGAVSAGLAVTVNGRDYPGA